MLGILPDGVYTTMNTTYSLWLLPDEASRSFFRAAITYFAERFSTPVFIPHMTLYGGIRSDDLSAVIAKCEHISKRARSIALSIASIGMQQERFRSLYLRVQRTPELDGLFTCAEEIFGGQRDIYPHISLLYGEIDRREKERVLREGNINIAMRAEAVALALWDTSGDVSEWREIAMWEIV